MSLLPKTKNIETSEPVIDLNSIITEIILCRKDPVYFISKYIFIRHPEKGVVKFDLYDYQRDVVKQFIEYRKNIVLKGRQLGLSTLYAAYILWRIIFFEAQDILIVANKGKTATEMIGRIKFMLKRLPEWMVPTKDAKSKKISPIDNQQSIQLFNDSKVQAITTTADSGIGNSLSLLVIDEAAAITPNKKAVEFWKSISPTIERGGDVIIISTPRDVGHWYHEMWVKAVKGENGFNPIVLGWQVHPDQDEEWARKTIKQENPEFFAREHACQFVGEGSALINHKVLESIRSKYESKPIRADSAMFDDSNSNNIYIYEESEETSRYMLTADIARGDAKDNSSFSIFKLPSLDDYLTVGIEQVAEYEGKIRPDHFAALCYEWCVKYNDAFFVAEANTYGNHVNIEMQNMGYENIWYDTSMAAKLNIYKNDKSKLTPGFSVSDKSRNLSLSILEAFFRKETIKIRGTRTYEELKTFVWDTKKERYEAMSGYNDDLVTSLWIASSVWYSLKIKERSNMFFMQFMTSNINYRKKDFDSQYAIFVRNNGFQKTGNVNSPDFIKQNNLQWLYGK
jgi:hypothetical protein